MSFLIFTYLMERFLRVLAIILHTQVCSPNYIWYVNLESAITGELSPLDFYLWGHIKSTAYSEDNISLPQLKVRIILAYEERKTENMWKSVHENLIRRTYLCMQYGGQHFQ